MVAESYILSSYKYSTGLVFQVKYTCFVILLSLTLSLPFCPHPLSLSLSTILDHKEFSSGLKNRVANFLSVSADSCLRTRHSKLSAAPLNESMKPRAEILTTLLTIKFVNYHNTCLVKCSVS